MEEIARGFFQKLFSTNEIGDTKHILTGVERCLSREDNLRLSVKCMKEEVCVALKSMGPTKALGDDSFLALFYQRCWHIVGNDVISYCLGILNDGKDLNSMNVTNIVLILKIPHPSNLVHLRLISMCNVFYKVVTKMVTNCFQHELNVCIDSAQSTFVPSCLISDNVMLTYENLHTYWQKRT